MSASNHTPVKRMPHEHDQTSDGQPAEPQLKMKQAYKDLQKGLVDTDMHGDRGVEEMVKNSSKGKAAKPRKIT